MKRRTLITLVLLAVTAGVLALWSSHEPNMDSADAAEVAGIPSAPEAAAPTAAPAATPRTAEAPHGQEHRSVTRNDGVDWTGTYSLEVEVDFTTPGLDGKPTPGRVTLAATLSLASDASHAPLRARPFLGRLSSVVRAAAGPGSTVWSDSALVERAQRPFVWAGAPRSGEVRLAPAVPEAVGLLLANVLGGLEVQLGDDDALGWTARHTTTDGPVEATYRMTTTELSKHWSRKEGGSAWSADDDALMSGRGETRYQIERRDDGAIIVHGAEHIAESRANVTLDARAPIRAVAKLKVRLKRVADAEVAWAGDVETDALKPFAFDFSKARPAPARAVARPVRAILADSVAAHQQSDAARRSLAQRQLAQKLRESDADVAEVLLFLAEPPGEDHDRRTALAALGDAATPAAQAALAEVLVDPEFDAAAQQGAATIATFLKVPAPEVLDALRTQARSWDGELPGEAAIYALAGQAHQQEPLDATLSAQLADEVRRMASLGLGVTSGGLTSPSAESVGAPAPVAVAPAEEPLLLDTSVFGAGATPHAKRVWLRALGTVGGKDSFPLIQPFLDHADDLTRAAAYESLRFIDLPEARQRVAKGMLTDEDQFVRIAAISVARYQPPAVFQETVLESLRTDIAPNVRFEAAHLVAVWAFEAPVLYQHLKTAIDREAHPKVKRGLQGLWPSFDGKLVVDPTHGIGPKEPLP